MPCEAPQAVIAAEGSFAAIVQRFVGGANSQAAATGTGTGRMQPAASANAKQSGTAQGLVTTNGSQQSGGATQAKANPDRNDQRTISAGDAATSEVAAAQAKPVAKPGQPGLVEQQPSQGGGAADATADTQASKNAAHALPSAIDGKVESAAVGPDVGPAGPMPPVMGNRPQVGGTAAGVSTDNAEAAEPVKVGAAGPVKAVRKEGDSSQKPSALVGVQAAAESKGGAVHGGGQSPQPVVAEAVAGGSGNYGAKSGPEVAAGAASAGEARSLAQAGALPQETSVVNQIAQQLRADNLRAGQQIVIRLNPPELGRVRLSLQAQGRDLRGLLEVDNPRALAELQREAPILVSRLAESGVNLHRMEIVLNDANQQAGAQNFGSLVREDQSQRQETPAAQQPTTDGSVFDEAASEAGVPAQEAVVSDDSVNVWM